MLILHIASSLGKLWITHFSLCASTKKKKNDGYAEIWKWREGLWGAGEVLRIWHALFPLRSIYSEKVRGSVLRTLRQSQGLSVEKIQSCSEISFNDEIGLAGRKETLASCKGYRDDNFSEYLWRWEYVYTGILDSYIPEKEETNSLIEMEGKYW